MKRNREFEKICRHYYGNIIDTFGWRKQQTDGRQNAESCGMASYLLLRKLYAAIGMHFASSVTVGIKQ